MADLIARRGLFVLLLMAAAVFTANAHQQSLGSLDDCHYARKGVEMAERHAFFTVTYAGHISYQHAPLQLWILSRMFATFGVNDFAARLPSIVMALGILLLVYEIGYRVLSAPAALASVALLLTTPAFLQNARRCMLEIPTCFWVCLFFLVYLEGLECPRRFLLLSIPLAAALLTKSVVGLVPVAVVTVASLWRDFRPRRGLGYLAAGIALGVVGGASWAIHQGLAHGWDGVRWHYFGEVGRAWAGSHLLDYVIAYPRIALASFQPVVIPGLIGAVLVWRGADREERPRAKLLALWIGVWLFVASLSSARTARYVWPILVPLSLACGYLLARWSPRVTRIFAVRVVPALLMVGALAFWVSPAVLTRDLNAPFKENRQILRTVLPEGSGLPLLGDSTWRLINPLLYYGHQSLGTVSQDPAEVAAAARRLPRPVLLVGKTFLQGWKAHGLPYRELAEVVNWNLVELTARVGLRRVPGDGLIPDFGVPRLVYCELTRHPMRTRFQRRKRGKLGECPEDADAPEDLAERVTYVGSPRAQRSSAPCGSATATLGRDALPVAHDVGNRRQYRGFAGGHSEEVREFRFRGRLCRSGR